MEKSNNKGITLISLAITIIVLIIISSITIKLGIDGINQARENTAIAEVSMVQHAILERYTKAKTINNMLILPSAGAYTDISNIVEDINKNSSDQDITLKDADSSNYHLLQSEQLRELGLSNVEDEYVVNYLTGEVFNITKQMTKSGKALYVYAQENK